MKKSFLIVFLVLFLAPFFVQAQGLVPCGGTGQDPCTFCDFFVLFKKIIDFILLSIIPPIAILMVVIGGAMFFLAAGNPENINRAKSLLKSVAIG